MHRMKEIKANVIVLSVTVTHGVFALFLMRGIAHISVMYFDRLLVYSSMLWIFISSAFYLTIQVVLHKKNILREIVFAIIFGIVSTCFKALLDFLQAKIGLVVVGLCSSIVLDEICTIVYGVALMSVLFFVVGKQKIQKDWKKAIRTPSIVLLIILGVYTVFWLSNLYNFQSAIDKFNATKDEIMNLDYYYSYRFSKYNVATYVAFYPVFWWLLSRCTVEGNEQKYPPAKD